MEFGNLGLRETAKKMDSGNSVYSLRMGKGCKSGIWAWFSGNINFDSCLLFWFLPFSAEGYIFFLYL